MERGMKVQEVILRALVKNHLVAGGGDVSGINDRLDPTPSGSAAWHVVKDRHSVSVRPRGHNMLVRKPLVERLITAQLMAFTHSSREAPFLRPYPPPLPIIDPLSALPLE